MWFYYALIPISLDHEILIRWLLFGFGCLLFLFRRLGESLPDRFDVAFIGLDHLAKSDSSRVLLLHQLHQLVNLIISSGQDGSIRLVLLLRLVKYLGLLYFGDQVAVKGLLNKTSVILSKLKLNHRQTTADFLHRSLRRLDRSNFLWLERIE